MKSGTKDLLVAIGVSAGLFLTAKQRQHSRVGRHFHPSKLPRS